MDMSKDSEEVKNSDLAENWPEVCRKYVLPPLTNFGIFFNGVSILILLMNRIKLRRSLAHFFAYLNFSDSWVFWFWVRIWKEKWILFSIFSVFLTCMFLTFSLPRLSSEYAEIVPIAAPYIVPILQTSLTISVFMTVAIAITAVLYIKPQTLPSNIEENNAEENIENSSDQNASNTSNQSKLCCYRMQRKYVCLVIVIVTFVSILFNLSRWFELRSEERFVSWTKEN